ncbi:MAG TPA: peptidoglycan DD-metalloendopeptidase family protein [Burkholderiales bacterium]|nr:peptidoglycan DD-metalloendopeptidase family protein [Burkholderiales bacterium]
MTKLAAASMIVVVAGCASQHGPAPVVDRTGRPQAPVAQPAQKPVVATPAPTPVAEGLYVVKKGDTLYSIALENGADYREVAQWNSLDDPTRILVGQVLRVRAPETAMTGTVVGRVESRAIESRPLEAPLPAVVPKPPPIAAIPAPTAPAASTAPAGGEFMWPARGKILAGFAEPRSKGIDIDGKPGDPIVAAAAGRVTYIGSGIPGLGKLVVIKHDNGFITVYAHNRDIVVKEQQSVSRGQKIAELGSSDADRPKLHFQIRKGSAAVDPLRYLPAL